VGTVLSVRANTDPSNLAFLRTERLRIPCVDSSSPSRRSHLPATSPTNVFNGPSDRQSLSTEAPPTCVNRLSDSGSLGGSVAESDGIDEITVGLLIKDALLVPLGLALESWVVGTDAMLVPLGLSLESWVVGKDVLTVPASHHPNDNHERCLKLSLGEGIGASICVDGVSNGPGGETGTFAAQEVIKMLAKRLIHAKFSSLNFEERWIEAVIEKVRSLVSGVQKEVFESKVFQGHEGSRTTATVVLHIQRDTQWIVVSAFLGDCDSVVISEGKVWELNPQNFLVSEKLPFYEARQLNKEMASIRNTACPGKLIGVPMTKTTWAEFTKPRTGRLQTMHRTEDQLLGKPPYITGMIVSLKGCEESGSPYLVTYSDGIADNILPEDLKKLLLNMRYCSESKMAISVLASIAYLIGLKPDDITVMLDNPNYIGAESPCLVGDDMRSTPFSQAIKEVLDSNKEQVVLNLKKIMKFIHKTGSDLPFHNALTALKVLSSFVNLTEIFSEFEGEVIADSKEEDLLDSGGNLESMGTDLRSDFTLFS